MDKRRLTTTATSQSGILPQGKPGHTSVGVTPAEATRDRYYFRHERRPMVEKEGGRTDPPAIQPSRNPRPSGFRRTQLSPPVDQRMRTDNLAFLPATPNPSPNRINPAAYMVTEETADITRLPDKQILPKHHCRQEHKFYKSNESREIYCITAKSMKSTK